MIGDGDTNVARCSSEAIGESDQTKTARDFARAPILLDFSTAAMALYVMGHAGERGVRKAWRLSDKSAKVVQFGTPHRAVGRYGERQCDGLA